jgi:hypothetical protein
VLAMTRRTCETRAVGWPAIRTRLPSSAQPEKETGDILSMKSSTDEERNENRGSSHEPLYGDAPHEQARIPRQDEINLILIPKYGEYDRF